MSQYRHLLAELTSSINKFTAYDELTDGLVAYILCLVRRGPVALKKATVPDYQRMETTSNLEKLALDMGMKEGDFKLSKNLYMFNVLKNN